MAPAGRDENPGSEAEPLPTIQKAASLARAGDTILLRGGVDREAVVLRFSGEKGKPIVLKNYPGERPVIQSGERGERPPGHGRAVCCEWERPRGPRTLADLMPDVQLTATAQSRPRVCGHAISAGSRGCSPIRPSRAAKAYKTRSQALDNVRK
ncbi:MAG: hypothetical protein HY000_34475 [Planctomycetes bacterium]|nr:hypothetical protein [Planctomycetota bacterium]